MSCRDPTEYSLLSKTVSKSSISAIHEQYFLRIESEIRFLNRSISKVRRQRIQIGMFNWQISLNYEKRKTRWLKNKNLKDLHLLFFTDEFHSSNSYVKHNFILVRIQKINLFFLYQNLMQTGRIFVKPWTLRACDALLIAHLPMKFTLDI